MKNIESAKIAIESEINLLESRLKICQQIKEGLLTLSEGVEMPINIENAGATDSVSTVDLKEFPDYPVNKRLFERLKYLDEKFPRAWKMRDRQELMVKIEGPESRERFRNMSVELKTLINSGLYVGAKYNNYNKFQFYCRPEWLSDDGLSIKPEYAPTDEDFVPLPLYKRKNELIVWMKGK